MTLTIDLYTARVYTENMKEVNYHSKIVGTTFENRQDILAHLEGNESLRVRREPENQYDPRAVAVDVDIKGKWYPVGYIAKDKNKDIAEALDAGREVEIKISEITGGDKGKNLGMNICLKYEKDGPEPISDATNDSAASEAATAGALRSTEGPQSVNLKNPTVYKSKVLGREITVGVDDGHIYLQHYMSGSRFPRRFFKQFTDDDKERVLDYYEREKDVKREDVEKTWEMKADIATGYGTAVHAALELYYGLNKVGDKIKGKDGVNKVFSKNPFFAHIVKCAVEDLGPGNYLPEQFIWHEGLRFCGAIDLLQVVDKNTVIIHDWKSNDSVTKRVYQEKDSPFKEDVDNTQLGEYWLQLSFYAYILKQYGINVKELQIHHLDPERLVQGKRPWVHYTHDVVDISKALKED
nr:MAG TPA: ATP dependent helicase [Caudoviricetes sp.]